MIPFSAQSGVRESTTMINASAVMYFLDESTAVEHRQKQFRQAGNTINRPNND